MVDKNPSFCKPAFYSYKAELCNFCLWLTDTRKTSVLEEPMVYNRHHNGSVPLSLMFWFSLFHPRRLAPSQCPITEKSFELHQIPLEQQPSDNLNSYRQGPCLMLKKELPSSLAQFLFDLNGHLWALRQTKSVLQHDDNQAGFRLQCQQWWKHSKYECLQQKHLLCMQICVYHSLLFAVDHAFEIKTPASQCVWWTVDELGVSLWNDSWSPQSVHQFMEYVNIHFHWILLE